MNLQSEQLVEAVILWAGKGVSPMPSRNESRVVARFGEQNAAALLATIKRLEDDFYASDAHLTSANLQEMGERAAEEFRSMYPTIAEEIVRTFVWCYTFDYR